MSDSEEVPLNGNKTLLEEETAASRSIDKHDIADVGTIEGFGQWRTINNFVSYIHWADKFFSCYDPYYFWDSPNQPSAGILRTHARENLR